MAPQKGDRIIRFLLKITILFSLGCLIDLFYARWLDFQNFSISDVTLIPLTVILLIIAIVTMVAVIGLIIVNRKYIKKGQNSSKKFKITSVFLIFFLILGGFTSLMVAIPSFPVMIYKGGPYLTWSNNQDPSSAITICWHSSFGEKGLVEYGEDPANLDLSATEDYWGQFHQIQLNGLSENTTYYYRIPKLYDKIFEFTTAPVDPHNFTFLVWSDPRQNDFITTALKQPNMPEIMSKNLEDDNTDLAFSICTGDIAYTSFDGFTWKLWLEDIATNDFASNASHVVAPGNHERLVDTNSNAFRQFYPYENLSYSYNYGGLHTIILDTWVPTDWWFSEHLTQELYDWLEADLIANADANFTIIGLHALNLNWGSTEPDWFMTDIFDNISSLAETYGVDAVFYGHKHHYEVNLINGVYYFNMGIGGYSDQNPMEDGPYLNAKSGDYGYCRVDVTPTTMNIIPTWQNATEIDNFLVSA